MGRRVAPEDALFASLQETMRQQREELEAIKEQLEIAQATIALLLSTVSGLPTPSEARTGWIRFASDGIAPDGSTSGCAVVAAPNGAGGYMWRRVSDGRAPDTGHAVTISADPGAGSSGQVRLSNQSDTPTASLTWSTAPALYWRIYVGTQAYVIPMWET